MAVPINAPIIGREEAKAVNDVLRNGLLTSSAMSGGRCVQEFEQQALSFLGSKFAVAVNSGTAALQAALLALNVQAGDEVLLPSFTFVSTANAVASVGAKPVFVDILRDNYTIDLSDLRRKITKKSRAVIPVHLYGSIAFMDEILEIANDNSLKIIEDAAQAMGSVIDGRHAGTFGDISCCSLYPAKVITSGEGGLAVTSSKQLRDKLRMIRNHGMVKGYDTRILGLNLRMPEINAAIAAQQMKKLPKFLAARRRNARYLSKLISDAKITIPAERPGERRNWYLYTIALRDRNKLLRQLNSAGFGAAVYYATPVHKTPYYKTQIKLPETDRAAGRVISVPVHPKVTVDDLDAMAKIILSFAS